MSGFDLTFDLSDSGPVITIIMLKMLSEVCT